MPAHIIAPDLMGLVMAVVMLVFVKKIFFRKIEVV